MKTDLETLSVESSHNGHLVTVWLDRPEVLNAVSSVMLEELVEVFEAFDDAIEVRCVVLRGRGRAFSVGADQKERPNMTLDDIRRRRRIAPSAFSVMRRSLRPVIAQVHGYAFGSGLELALACDLTVVADSTVLGLIESVKASMPAGGGTQILPRLIGPQRAKELIFTGRRFSAADARDWNLFNHVVSETELDGQVEELAGEIMAAAPLSTIQAKRAINMSLDVDLATGFQVEAALYERVLTSKDRLEALAAYQEGRPASFRGE
jgi:enoyl-CoA hydratase/carnithine racemase